MLNLSRVTLLNFLLHTCEFSRRPTYIASEEWSTALNAYNQALSISRHLNDKVKETTVLNQMGKIQAALGQNSTALGVTH